MPSGYALKKAARVLHDGGIVAYPTEAVFGLGCDPADPVAVFRLLKIKDRSVGPGLILVASDIDQFDPFVGPLTAVEHIRLEETWPGPITWLVTANAAAPFWITGGRERIAVRVTAHPIAAALCRAADMALVATSANRTGTLPVRTALNARLRFGQDVDYILGGSVGGRPRPTEIRDARTGDIIRR